MKITQLEQISEIAATRSLGQAAKNLYISQPALSYSLKTLEDELGKPLFSRGRNGVELTDFGKEFLIYVRPILEQWELLRKISGSIDREPPEEFGVSSAYLPLPRDLLPELLEEWKDRDIRFSLYERTVEGVVQDLARRRSQIGIVNTSRLLDRRNRELFRQNGLTYTPVYKDDRNYVVIGPHHPLFSSDLEEVTLEMLRSYPLLSYADILPSFPYDYRILGIDSFRRRIKVDDRVAYDSLIARTDCVTICNYGSCFYLDEKEQNVRIFLLKAENDSFAGYEIGWARRADQPLTPVGRSFIEKFCRMTRQGIALRARLMKTCTSEKTVGAAKIANHDVK